MTKRISVILLFLFSLAGFSAKASHIVGGDFTYRYLGDTVVFGTTLMKYQVTLFIYQDCVTGVPDAIAQDNPAYLTVYELNAAKEYVLNDSIYYDSNPTSGGAIVVPANFSNDCVKNIPQLCLLRKRFSRTYYLPQSAFGYIFVYQRCCRNSSIINVINPGDEGATYYCKIPPSTLRNNAAVFNNYPPQIICLNNPLYYDHSATDADGDSLSYEFCPAEKGADGLDIKPKIADTPDYAFVQYFPPYTYQNPITGFPAIQVDPRTGLITGTPNRIGRYLVTVCCHEWRGGQIINTTKREFQFVVTDCSKVVVADIPILSNSPNTFIVNCVDYRVKFVNNSSGGFSYRWDFGFDGGGGSATQFEPEITYPDTGTYAVKLIVNPGSTCPDSITRLVKIYPSFKTNFKDSGNYCPGVAIQFTDLTTSTIKPVVSWYWNFGDGTTSTDANPIHTYPRGGTYNVVLAAENIKNCVDTTFKRVIIQDFRPYAGDDTIIVKGESIQFDARGGTKYSWVPADNLTDTSIGNPVGFYPDTGLFTYRLFVQSNYGCSGYDTITVWVVDKASFVVPNAFSPNGDGLNDFFRAKAVGYRGLKFFRVFNRWGQEVYHSKSLESGWDGTFNNMPAEMGVYFWQIAYTDRFGKDGFVKGDVTLLR